MLLAYSISSTRNLGELLKNMVQIAHIVQTVDNESLQI